MLHAQQVPGFGVSVASPALARWRGVTGVGGCVPRPHHQHQPSSPSPSATSPCGQLLSGSARPVSRRQKAALLPALLQLLPELPQFHQIIRPRKSDGSSSFSRKSALPPLSSQAKKSSSVSLDREKDNSSAGSTYRAFSGTAKSFHREEFSSSAVLSFLQSPFAAVNIRSDYKFNEYIII